MSLALADPGVLVPLAAIGRAMQEDFDPKRFLGEFSESIREIVPHDRLVIDHLDEGGQTFTVFAEHAPPDLVLHDEHYTTTFRPQARYIVDEWVLRFVFAGDALFPGGNDYSVKEAGVEAIQVNNAEETKRVVETFLARSAGIESTARREEVAR